MCRLGFAVISEAPHLLATFHQPYAHATYPTFLAPTASSPSTEAKISTQLLPHHVPWFSSTTFTYRFCNRLETMSGRLITTKLQLAQRAFSSGARHLHHHSYSSAGGLLRSDAAVRAVRRRIWPAGYTPFSNAVAVRNASYMRIIPQLLLKFVRIPALFGGATIAGLAYIQYQAARKCIPF